MISSNPKTFLDQAFYKNVLESLEDYGVMTTDMEGIVTSWNTGAENIFGYLEDEICGISGKIIFTVEDCENGVPEHEFTEAQEKGRGLDERFHRKKDGSLFWASGLIFPLFDSAKIQIGFTKILRNLSHRKQAEEELQNTRRYAQGIVETSKEPLVIVEPDLTLTTGSPAFYRLFSLEKSESEHHNIFELLKRRLDPAPLQTEMQKEDGFENVELTLPATDPCGPQILLVSSRKIFVTHKAIGQILLTFEDITESRREEMTKDAFISVASHELKTPITSLTIALQLLEKLTSEKDDFKSLHLLAQKASSKVGKLTQLVKDLLDVTKIQSSKINLVLSDFPFLELLNECIEDLESIFNGSLIEVSSPTGKMITADRGRLGQVIINFISNAVKYSPNSKRVVITVVYTKLDVKVAVRDFGVGIPESKIPFVFDRFYRVESTSQNFSGLGLGLYISSEIIRQHKGNIGVESKVGEGSTFWFSVPIA